MPISLHPSSDTLAKAAPTQTVIISFRLSHFLPRFHLPPFATESLLHYAWLLSFSKHITESVTGVSVEHVKAYISFDSRKMRQGPGYVLPIPVQIFQVQIGFLSSNSIAYCTILIHMIFKQFLRSHWHIRIAYFKLCNVMIWNTYTLWNDYYLACFLISSSWTGLGPA